MLAEVGELGMAVKLSGGALGAKEKIKKNWWFCLPVAQYTGAQYIVPLTNLHACRVVAEIEVVATDTGPYTLTAVITQE
jgi:hypothetical protein